MKHRHLIFTMFFYLAATACRAFVGIYLGRVLSIEDFSTFFLAFTVIQVGTFICLFGIGSETVRFFSREPLSSFQWRKTYGLILVVLIGVATFVGAFSWLLYDLSATIVLLTVSILVFKAGLELQSALFRAGEEYVPALTSQNLVPVVFAALVFFLYQTGIESGVDGLLFLFLCISAVVYMPHLVMLTRRFPEGPKPIGREMLVDGFWLFVMEIAGVMFMYIDRLVLGGMASPAAFATYFALLQLAYGYEVAAFGLEFVLIPSVNSAAGRQSLFRAAYLVVLGTAAITIIYFLLGEWVLDLIYKGKYNHGLFLLPYFCAAGAVKVFWILPHSILMGRADLATTRLFSGYNWGMTIMFGALFPLFVHWDGLRGGAICCILIWLVRFLVEVIFSIRIIGDHPDLMGDAADDVQ